MVPQQMSAMCIGGNKSVSKTTFPATAAAAISQPISPRWSNIHRGKRQQRVTALRDTQQNSKPEGCHQTDTPSTITEPADVQSRSDKAVALFTPLMGIGKYQGAVCICNAFGTTVASVRPEDATRQTSLELAKHALARADVITGFNLPDVFQTLCISPPHCKRLDLAHELTMTDRMKVSEHGSSPEEIARWCAQSAKRMDATQLRTGHPPSYFPKQQ